jgi:hypothetical protein
LEMGVSQTCWLSWPWIVILLNSASQVARITNMIHQSPAPWMQIKTRLFTCYKDQME